MLLAINLIKDPVPDMAASISHWFHGRLARAGAGVVQEQLLPSLAQPGGHRAGQLWSWDEAQRQDEAAR